MAILEKISSPEALRDLTNDELKTLCGELRERIVNVVSAHGGHLGANLGAVEFTVAMLRSFDLPADKVVWDVGHQAYAFKLLTGRQEQFNDLREFNGCCGFPVRNESIYDCYSAGHAGVAVSAALGMCECQKSDSHNKIIAVVGDGAIGSGVALEGLNHVRENGRNLVIILNDNSMAIGPNVGALSRVFNHLLTSRRYRWSRGIAETMLKFLPKWQKIQNFVSSIEDAVKNLLIPSEPFQSLGIRYLGPINGHSMRHLERAFEAVKRDERPTIIHVVTQKGRGFAPAVSSPERFHGIGKFDPATGESLSISIPGFSAAAGAAACELAEKNPDLTAVVAAMASGVGLSKFAERYPERFYDAGMAESHAVSFSSGLAASGKSVICAIYATFMQRSLDHIFHDVCLMDLPVVFTLDRAGLVEDGPTHHGIHDLGFLLAIPNLTVMQPGCEAEMKPMMELAVSSRKPVVIRYPRGNSAAHKRSDIPQIPLEPGKAAVWRNGNDLAIYAVGAEAVRALTLADILKEKYNLSARVVNVRFLKPFDSTLLLEDLKKMPVFTLEDHVVSTGLGAIAAQCAAQITGKYNVKLQSFGCPDSTVVPYGSVNELRKLLQLDEKSLAEKIAGAVNAFRANQ